MRPRWPASFFLALSACTPAAEAPPGGCYEVRGTTDSSWSGFDGSDRSDIDRVPRTWIDTFDLLSARIDPFLRTLPDSGPWNRVSMPSAPQVTWVAWSTRGRWILIDTHDGFTGATYRLRRRGPALVGGGVWVPDLGRSAAHSLKLLPLPGGCTPRQARRPGDSL